MENLDSNKYKVECEFATNEQLKIRSIENVLQQTTKS